MYNNVSSVQGAKINAYNTVKKMGKPAAVNPFFGEDSFSISEDAKIVSSALSQVKVALNEEMSNLDQSKINAIKQKIQNGSYNISSQDVAEKILRG